MCRHSYWWLQCTFFYILRNKSEVSQLILEFTAMVECQTIKKLKVLCTDGGGDYVSQFLQKKVEGLGHHSIHYDTPIEWHHRTCKQV